MSAECTITAGSEPSLIDSPNIEIAQVTATNNETYTSRKFRRITGCIPTLNMASYTDEFISAEISSTKNQVTIHIAGSDTTDEKVTLLLWGES